MGPGSLNPPPDTLSEALDCDLSFTTNGDWSVDSRMDSEYYYEADSAESDHISDDEEACMQTIVDVDVQETVTFYWKVSSEEGDDYLEFYIDGVLRIGLAERWTGRRRRTM